MDNSSREQAPLPPITSSIMTDTVTCGIMNSDSKIILPTNGSGILVAQGAGSTNTASGNNHNNNSTTTKEKVSCIVKSKERLLGHVYLNGNGVYCEYICTGSVSYKPGDSVYLERSSRRDTFETFNIVKIIDFLRSERDGCLYVRVRGYHRLTEIPVSWYPYFQDRDNVNNSGVEIIAKESSASSRELVFSDSCECYPVSALRGLSNVRHFKNHQSAKEFEPRPDSFYYIFWKNSHGPTKDKELASTQGEIRVGANFQAKLPACEARLAQDYLARECPEDALWRPKACQDDDEFGMYQASVRSICTYRNISGSESIQDDYYAAYMREEEVQMTYDTLHKCDYDCESALEKVLKNLEIQSSQMVRKKFREEETQRFIKGIRKVGKNFFKIQKDFLPQRTTAQLIEYYYLWKKSPNALKTLRRPPNGSRRQTGAVVRRMRGRPNRASISSDYVESLSPSSDEERESDDSDKDLSNYQCSNCSATESKEWHPTTKDKTSVLCSDCRLFYKKYGELRPTEERENSFNFKAAGDEENNENVAVAKNGPTTRRAVGRPKSALAVSSPEAAEKSRRSPGTVSVSSSSSGGDQKKKPRGKGSKASKTSKEAEPSVTSEAPSTPTGGRKRRKTSASETHSESSFTECDIPPTVEDGGVSGRVVERAVGTTPPTVASPTAEIQMNFSSLEVKPHPHLPSSASPCLSPKATSDSLQGKVQVPGTSEGSRPGTSPSVTVKTEFVPPVTKVKTEEGTRAESPRQNDKSRRRDKENIRLELEDIVPDVEDSPRPMDGRKLPRDQTPEPKPDHVLIENPRWENSRFYRVWNRGENNSCARTDYAFAPLSSSKLAKRRAEATTMVSPSKTTKSPAPAKDGKRTPMTSQQSGGERDRERERDNRSATTLSGPRIADTPPGHRDRGLVQRQTSLSGMPMPDSMLHGPGGPYGGISPQMHYQERMRLMELQERERSLQFARAGSVPPGMMSPHDMMEIQRRMQMQPGMMGMFPGMNAQQAAAANYAVAEQQQREMSMMASMMNGAGPPHQHAMLAAHLQNHPELQHDPAMLQHLFYGGAGGPFGPSGPFPPAHLGARATAEMMNLMGQPTSFEQQHVQFMAHQQAQAQAMQQRMDAEQQQAHAQAQLRMLQMSQHPGFHPDMMR